MDREVDAATATASPCMYNFASCIHSIHHSFAENGLRASSAKKSVRNAHAFLSDSNPVSVCCSIVFRHVHVEHAGCGVYMGCWSYVCTQVSHLLTGIELGRQLNGAGCPRRMRQALTRTACQAVEFGNHPEVKKRKEKGGIERDHPTEC